ncbi:TPM domain-containing protein [Mycobacterium sp. ACS4331]|uniref:TPM domain-containing protein n=1 Tax=Mycobacterium sp. ACS4331 TaxID=1834121 RepID=UPI0007FCF06C|nr:TPM domain-containing protein [Mycobacterium sp. ACS4331]OBF30436.1 hypothetical protein A5727_00015 [Mycobacterium sp. ACS4331]
MRLPRLLHILLVVVLAGLLTAPAAVAEPPFRLPSQVTDRSGVLSPKEEAEVQNALDRLYNDRHVQLWVVYVKSFDGLGWLNWAQNTMKASDFGDDDALLAIATEDRALAFQVPSTISGGTSTRSDDIRRLDIEPALRNGDWAGAAIAAADGLNADTGGTFKISWAPVLAALGVMALLVLILWLWVRRQRSKRHAAQVAAAHRVDPTDPNALAAVPLDALDELSRTIVVDVDNAVRTSQSELELAVEEFGTTATAPFSEAVANAKTTLQQAFNVRQTLDDEVPETPLQRRDLLTRVIVAAAKADRALEEQSAAFQKLRDLLINAPTRLDALTQQMVALSARVEPAAQRLAALRQQFAEAALTSVAGNIDAARSRLTFADRSITDGRNLISRPAPNQNPLVDAIRAAEGALGQAQTLLDAIETASTDINRAIAALPDEIADIQRGIDAAATQLPLAQGAQRDELARARDAAIKAVEDAKTNGANDPLGTFTRLTKADADLDQILDLVDAQRQEAEKQAKLLEQALFTAQSRVRSVSDFIDTRRGSVGPEARTRLAEATRQLEAAQAKRDSNPAEAIAHANGAAALAAQAQTLANEDVRSTQHAYSSQYGGSGGSDLGSVIGGIIIGNVLRGGFSGRGGYGGGWGGSWGGSWGGGRSPGRPTTYGGSSRSSTRSYGGGGGRF